MAGLDRPSVSRGSTIIKKERRVFLLGNARKPDVPPAFERLGDLLEQRGVLVGSDLDGHPQRINAAHPDLVVVLGGDGTILSAAQAMQHDQVPIVGVNVGKLGYLADFTIDEFEQHMDQILDDHDLVGRRMMLTVVIAEPSGATWQGVALNDCVLRAGTSFRTIRMSVAADGYPLTTIVADGLVVATPTGSTAHNMSCGGPILQPEIEALILTPMAPHSLSHRPIVLRGDCHLEIEMLQTNESTAAVMDGQVIRSVPDGTRISVRRARERFQHVRNPSNQGWETLVTKLKWGQTLAAESRRP